MVIQAKFRSEEYKCFKHKIKKLKADLVISNSYSMLIRDDILCLHRLGGINIHHAFLPKYRGCNPTQWSIIRGENFTGVSIHEMNSVLDSGAIIDQSKVPILMDDTWLSSEFEG